MLLLGNHHLRDGSKTPCSVWEIICSRPHITPLLFFSLLPSSPAPSHLLLQPWMMLMTLLAEVEETLLSRRCVDVSVEGWQQMTWVLFVVVVSKLKHQCLLRLLNLLLRSNRGDFIWSWVWWLHMRYKANIISMKSDHFYTAIFNPLPWGVGVRRDDLEHAGETAGCTFSTRDSRVRVFQTEKTAPSHGTEIALWPQEAPRPTQSEGCWLELKSPCKELVLTGAAERDGDVLILVVCSSENVYWRFPAEIFDKGHVKRVKLRYL